MSTVAMPLLDLAKAVISIDSNHANKPKTTPVARTWVDPSSVLCNICMASRLHLPMDTSTNPYGSKAVHVNCRQNVRLLEEYLQRNITAITAGDAIQTNEILVLVVKKLYELILQQTSERTINSFANRFKLHEEFKPLANLALEAYVGKQRAVKVIDAKMAKASEAANSVDFAAPYN